jgi:hypothetical protein
MVGSIEIPWTERPRRRVLGPVTVVAAALLFAPLSAAPARAQVSLSFGFGLPGYWGGYYPYYYPYTAYYGYPYSYGYPYYYPAGVYWGHPYYRHHYWRRYHHYWR